MNTFPKLTVGRPGPHGTYSSNTLFEHREDGVEQAVGMVYGLPIHCMLEDILKDALDPNYPQRRREEMLAALRWGRLFAESGEMLDILRTIMAQRCGLPYGVHERIKAAIERIDTEPKLTEAAAS